MHFFKSRSMDGVVRTFLGVAALACLSHVQLALADAPIGPFTLTDYDEETYAGMYKKLGKDGVQKLMAAERRAVEHVVKSPACDETRNSVYKMELSDKGNGAVVEVICENGNQFLVGDAELAQPGADLKYEHISE